MNRRNFLKLLGIGLLPASILPARADTVEPTVETVGDSADWMILRTPERGMYSVEIDNQDVSCLRDEIAAETKEHIKWQSEMLANIPSDSQFLLVSEKSMVYVTAPSGQRVWFRPVWNTVDERFETVSIESQICHDIFMDDTGGMTAQSKATTMMAIADGEVIAKTIQDIVT